MWGQQVPFLCNYTKISLFKKIAVIFDTIIKCNIFYFITSLSALAWQHHNNIFTKGDRLNQFINYEDVGRAAPGFDRVCFKKAS